MSLSTTKRDFVGVLHELADEAYFKRTMLVASAHNMPVESFPWKFSSVISVGSHELDDPFAFFYNPTPPLVIEEVAADKRWSRDTAESTGFVPKGLMAVPLLHEERSLGVLEVLDRPADSRFSLQEMDLLSLFANQAAIALDLLQRARQAQAVLADHGDVAVLARVAAALGEDEEEGGTRREAGLRPLAALEELL